MQVVPMEEQPKYGVVVGVTEQPAPSGVVVGVLTEQPGASSGGAARGVVDQTLAMLDGLLSTEEISGDYRCCCFPVCESMSVVPLGPDAIETWNTTCCFLPPMIIAPFAVVEVRTRKPGTNAFLNPQHPDPTSDLMTFSADGTADGCYKKRPGSQKRAFHKVETRDLAGNWCGCQFWQVVPFWPFFPSLCTAKKALNEDQYEESGLCFILCLPCPVETTTHTRKYVNGHPTNAFDGYDWQGQPVTNWHRDPGCAAASDQRTWCKLPY